jgi:hypothetical protein
MRRREVWSTKFLLGLLLLVSLGCEPSSALKMKRTVVAMRALNGWLVDTQPRSTSRSALEEILRDEGRQLSLADEWGHDFVIEVVSPTKEISEYRIISVGRDGRRGSCCVKFTMSLDDDAVMENGHLVQNWHAKAD